MSNLDVIELPGTGMFARRFVVDAWLAAGSPPLNSAGRLKREQQDLYDGWAARLPGYAPADNPNDERQPLAHVRFVALDIDPTPERVRALQATGMVRPYGYEPWHWQAPGDVRVYPLVTSIPTTDQALLRRQREDTMYVQGKSDKTSVYNVFTDATGKPAMRLCGTGEAAYARGNGLIAFGDDGTLMMLSKECGYDVTAKTTDAARRISDLIWSRQIDRSTGKVSVLQDIADTGTIARTLG